MEREEIMRWHFILISDTRVEKRQEAERALSSDGGRECSILAKTGSIIGRAVCENKPIDGLDNAIIALDSLPPTAFWSRFIEISGQVLIMAGAERSGNKGPQEAGSAIEAGLKMLALVQSRGIPLSDFSMRQVMQVLDGGGALIGAARAIIRQNEGLMPERTRMPRHPKEKTPANTENNPKERSRQG